MIEHSKIVPPEVSAADHGHATGRALFSAIPFVGGAAVEIFTALLTPQIERRRHEWMTAIGNAIEELQMRDANIVESLQHNEAFQSVLLQASWAAVRNHQSEKLIALKNAVINAAAGHTLEEDWMLLFVRYVDELTPTHFVVLNYLSINEPAIAFLESLQKLSQRFNDESGREVPADHFQLICDDLAARGLLRLSESIRDLPGVYGHTLLQVEDSPNDNPKILVTEYGRAFVSFVLMTKSHSAEEGTE